MTKWKPIDTAPLGDAILLANEGSAAAVGRWSAVSEQWVIEGLSFNGCAMLNKWRHPKWGFEEIIMEKPTHWMPLPEPPSTSPHAPE